MRGRPRVLAPLLLPTPVSSGGGDGGGEGGGDIDRVSEHLVKAVGAFTADEILSFRRVDTTEGKYAV